jgi:hypothetical protein
MKNWFLKSPEADALFIILTCIFGLLSPFSFEALLVALLLTVVYFSRRLFL